MWNSHLLWTTTKQQMQTANHKQSDRDMSVKCQIEKHDKDFKEIHSITSPIIPSPANVTKASQRCGVLRIILHSNMTWFFSPIKSTDTNSTLFPDKS